MGYQYGDEPTFNLSKAAQWLGALNKYTTEADGYFNKASNANKKTKPPKNGDRNNTAEIKARLEQQKKEKAAALAITKGDYDHSSGSYRRILPEEETREVPGSDGRIVQTGKDLGGGGTPIDMSRSFNSLLNGVGQQPFGGSQLPTTMGNPYTATYKQTQGFGDEIPDIGGYNGATFDSELGRLAASSKDISKFAPMTGREVPIDGGAERIGLAATGITSSRLSDALNSVRSEVEMTPERRQQMARAAFLDTKGSQAGLRAKEAVNNVVYAGGKHYIPGESADSPAVFIDRSQARDISSGRSSAQSLLEAHIAKNKDVGEDTPASAQNPLSEAGDAIKSAFAAGAQTDFALNNNQVGPRTGVGPVVSPDIIENYDFTKPGAEEAYFKKLNSGGFFR